MNYIELSGKSYPIAFGYGALMEYETLTGKSAVQLLSKSEEVGITDMLTLLACGLANGAEQVGQSQEFTAKGVSKLLDATPNSAEAIQKAMEHFAASFAQEDTKKKTVKMQPTRAQRRKSG